MKPFTPDTPLLGIVDIDFEDTPKKFYSAGIWEYCKNWNSPPGHTLSMKVLHWSSVLSVSMCTVEILLSAVWNHTAARDLLGPDAMYVTILRHPVDLFESLYAYTNFQTVLKLSLHEYIESLNVSETLYKHR